MARQSRRGLEGKVRSGEADVDRKGLERNGSVGLGEARIGKNGGEWRGLVRIEVAWQ